MSKTKNKQTLPKRKIYLVDKKFQLKTAFTFTGVVLVFMSVVIAAMTLVMANNNKKLDDLYQQQEGLTFNQREIVESLLVFNRVRTWENLRLATDRATQDLQRNTEQIQGNQALIQRVILQNRILLAVIIAMAVIQLIVVFRMLIHKTHKVAGPVLLLSRYMDEVIRGKYPQPRALRDGDELGELYEKFNTMVTTIKERDEKRKKVTQRLKARVNDMRVANVPEEVKEA